MESTGSKELIKSILIMAGIPLAFSVACSLLSRIKEKTISLQIQETKFDSMYNDDDEDVTHLKEQISTLRCKIEELQDLEREIEVRFFRFIELKDQEYALMKVYDNMCPEKERAEFLQREALSTEEHNKKFDETMIEYLKALEEVESSRLEKIVLRRREKKLLKKLKESLRVIVKKNLKIEAQEADMLDKEVELQRKNVLIEGFESEVGEMRALIDRLHGERDEVSNKLEITENMVASKAEGEKILMESYTRVANELETVKKDRASELNELIYLRWCHACLRHELARRNELEQKTQNDDEKVNGHELGLVLSQSLASEECKGNESDNESVVHHNEPFFGSGQQHKKRRWLVRKFKKWVEGNEKHHDAKCVGSHLCVD